MGRICDRKRIIIITVMLLVMVSANRAHAGAHGYIGTAPAAELVPLKITDRGSVKVSTICRAIYGGIDDYDCDVLALSLGVAEDAKLIKNGIESRADICYNKLLLQNRTG